MTLKQIKFNPFKTLGITSDLYKQSFTKEERNSLFWTPLALTEKMDLHCVPYLIRELGVDFAVMSQTGQLVPFRLSGISFDSFLMDLEMYRFVR